MKVVDVATAIAPDMPHKNVGIRPGEKMHEVMCPRDDSHLTLEFHDHYVIKPSIQFTESADFTKNNCGEIGVPVDYGFKYSSETNTQWLNAEELLQKIALTQHEEK